jgi:hypothetical protein
MVREETMQIPAFGSYGNYSSDNCGAHTMVFTDAQGRDFYFSYRTLVAVYVPGKGRIVRENDWGPTTGKHLNWIDGGSKEDRLPREQFQATLKDWISA